MKNNLIVKSNDLIQAKYKLTLNQQKIILYAVSKIDRDKKEFNSIELDIKEFTDLLDSEGKRYDEIRNITRELRKREIIINTDDKEYITGWLSSVTLHKNTGKIKLSFDDDLVPYLLQLKEKFTRYQIKNILYLSNKHSIRIYELLKQYETIGKRTFKVDELKEILMLQDQYKRFNNFEQRVLKPTMEEINEYTDITIAYEKVRQGKSIHALKYTIKTKDECRYNEYLEDTYNIKAIKEGTGLQNENFTSEQIIKLYEIACYKMGDDYESELDIFNYIKLNYESIQDKENIRNRYSYLMDMLENDRAKAIVYIRTNKKPSSKELEGNRQGI